MKLIFFILLVVLIAQIGFWKTFAAVLGAFAMILLLGAVALAAVIVGGVLVVSALR